MKESLQKALDATETTYADLVSIANTIMKEHVAEVNKLIQQAYDNIDNLSNENIRQLITKLSLQSFNFGDVKDKATLKSKCAEALRAEAYALEFNKSEGSVAAKEHTATINTSDKILTNIIYDIIANMFKTKLDECHRVVAALTTVLTSRMSEAKLKANLCGNEG